MPRRRRRCSTRRLAGNGIRNKTFVSVSRPAFAGSRSPPEGGRYKFGGVWLQPDPGPPEAGRYRPDRRSRCSRSSNSDALHVLRCGKSP